MRTLTKQHLKQICLCLCLVIFITGCNRFPTLENPLKNITTTAQWETLCKEKKELLQKELYGIFPTEDRNVSVTGTTTPLPQWNAMMEESTITFGKNLTATLRITYPNDSQKHPVIFRLDYLSDYEYRAPVEEQMVKEQRYAFVTIGRNTTAPDEAQNREVFGLTQYKEQDLGAIALWAYAAVAAADYVSTLSFADTEKFAITGHSRDGKAAICAAVMDERFRVVAPNGSGVGGAASFRVSEEDSEPTTHLAEAFPHWFSSTFNNKAMNNTLTVDMLDAFCLLAPRGVLRTEAKNDVWANPNGVLAIQSAMNPVYEFLGTPTSYNQVVFREGEHGHTPEDWETLIRFCDHVFYGTDF